MARGSSRSAAGQEAGETAKGAARQQAKASAKAQTKRALDEAKAEAKSQARRAMGDAKADAKAETRRAVDTSAKGGGRGKTSPASGGTGGAKAKGGVERLVTKLEGSLSDKVEQHERAAERAAKKVQKHERVAERSAKTAAMLDHLADHLSALDVWTRADTATRKPRFSREEIASTAVRIADEEGFDALSMRHLAAELGAGTMTLYHYVRNRDELLTLVTDTVMGEVVLGADEDMPRDWRAALRVLAYKSLDAMRNHPWFMDIADDPPIGPNSVRHFDQTLEAVASLPIPLNEKLEIVSVVDEYVFGFCLQERNNLETDDGGHIPHDLMGYVGGLLESGDYPQLQQLTDEHGLEGTWSKISAGLRDPGRFDRNLERILDGIEAGLG